jgi:hypothetical protein
MNKSNNSLEKTNSVSKKDVFQWYNLGKASKLKRILALIVDNFIIFTSLSLLQMLIGPSIVLDLWGSSDKPEDYMMNFFIVFISFLPVVSIFRDAFYSPGRKLVGIRLSLGDFGSLRRNFILFIPFLGTIGEFFTFIASGNRLSEYISSIFWPRRDFSSVLVSYEQASANHNWIKCLILGHNWIDKTSEHERVDLLDVANAKVISKVEGVHHQCERCGIIAELICKSHNKHYLTRFVKDKSIGCGKQRCRICFVKVEYPNHYMIVTDRFEKWLEYRDRFGSGRQLVETSKKGYCKRCGESIYTNKDHFDRSSKMADFRS